MRCGKCPEVEMAVEVHGEVEIDRCPSCSGIFLDWGELTALLTQEGIENVDLPSDAPAEAAARDAMAAACSRCDLPMRPVATRMGIKLDTCGKCGGAFLDKGEFRVLVTSLAAKAGGG